MAREHTGTEPTQARSPLRLRAWMSGVMVVLTGASAVLLGVAAAGEDGGERRGLVVATAICLAVAVVAIVDLVVVARRIRRGDHG